MRKGFAVALVYVLLILIPVVIAALLVPPIVEQVNLLIQNLPKYAADLSDFVQRNDRLRSLEENYNITAELQKQAATLPARAGDAAAILSNIGLGVVNSVFAGVTILILSVFMVGSGRTWLDWLAQRQGPEHGEWIDAAVQPDRQRRRQLRGRRAGAGADRRACSRGSCCSSSACRTRARSP